LLLALGEDVALLTTAQKLLTRSLATLGNATQIHAIVCRIALRLIYTSVLGLVSLISDAISTEEILSFQIAITSGSDNK
jgi:hypothetical protein